MKTVFKMLYGNSLYISLIFGFIAFILSLRKIKSEEQPWYVGIILLASFTPMINTLSAFIYVVLALEAIMNSLNRLKAKERLKRIRKNSLKYENNI